MGIILFLGPHLVIHPSADRHQSIKRAASIWGQGLSVKPFQLCSTRHGTVTECLLWVPFACPLRQGPLVIPVAKAQRGEILAPGRPYCICREAMVDIEVRASHSLSEVLGTAGC